MRSWDVEADVAGPEIVLAEHVHWLNLSSDGSVLAANHWICDTATVKLQLGRPQPGQRPRVLVQNIVSVDDEGQPWATITSVEQPTKNSLVRFSADGARWETILDDLGQGQAWLSPDRKLLATVGHCQTARPCRGSTFGTLHRASA